MSEIPESERYSIECRVCEDTRFLTYSGGDYTCTVCGKVYDAESGVVDNIEAQYYYQLYQGAKIAGLIKEEDVYEEFYYD